MERRLAQQQEKLDNAREKRLKIAESSCQPDLKIDTCLSISIRGKTSSTTSHHID
jgi:hypothetical protein